jgi:hypothetical protein
MSLIPNDLTLRRDELCDALKLSPRVIEALITTGAVKSKKQHGMDVFAAADLEALFRDALMSLYCAQAKKAAGPVHAREPEQEFAAFDEEEEVPLPAPLPAPPPVMTPATAGYTVMDDAEEDLRLAARYIPRKEIGAMFRDVRCTVVQLSNTGMRIRHTEPLRPGDEAKLNIALLTASQSFVMRAEVVWTSIAHHGDAPSFYVSGLRVAGDAERLTAMVDLLRCNRELHLEQGERPRVPKNMPRPVSGLPDEDVVAIIRAVRRFTDDPVEANRWYTRARFSVSDEEVRKAAPRGGREREEVVGIWEYLQRRIDLRAVAGVVQWIRSSQVAAV